MNYDYENIKPVITSADIAVSADIAGTPAKTDEPASVINAANTYPAADNYEIEEEEVPSDFVSSLNQDDRDLSIRALEYVLKTAEIAMKDIKRNNGDVKKAWDYIKNTFGMEYGSDAVQGRIDLARQEIEDVKKGKLELGKVYKKLTGNELNAEELERIKNPHKNPDADKNDGVVRPSYVLDFSNAPSHRDASEYEAGQNQALEAAASITGAAAIMAVPATGGISLLAGTAAYAGVKGLDGSTRQTVYTLNETVSDIVKGAVSAGSTLTGMKLASAASGLLGRLGASMAIGMGNTGGNYIADKLLKGEKINSDELQKILASSGAASVLGGLAGIGAQQVISRFAALGADAGAKVLNRLLNAGITGGAAGGAAAAGAGGAGYIIDYLKNENKEFNMDEFLNACSKNVLTGAGTGAAAGVLIEGANIAGEKVSAMFKAEPAAVSKVLTKDSAEMQALPRHKFMSKANEVQAYRFNPNGTEEEILANNPGVFVKDGKFYIPNKWNENEPYLINPGKEQMIMLYGGDDMAVCDGGVFQLSYVDTARFKAGSSEYQNPSNLEYGKVVNVTKQAPGSFVDLPAGTKVQTLEGVRTVEEGSIVTIDSAGNPYIQPAANILKRNEGFDAETLRILNSKIPQPNPNK